MKRKLFVVIAIVLVLSLFSMNVFAEESTGYSDVNKTAWYAEAVDYVTEHELMYGVGNGRFEPMGTTTRAMVVAVLWRHYGAPAYEFSGTVFLDLKDGQWYSAAAEWAYYADIVDGIPLTFISDEPTGFSVNFAPEQMITREQLAAFIYRYASFLGADVSQRVDLSAFKDQSSVSSWAVTAMQWCVAEGIIYGIEETDAVRLDPKGTATRAQVATILMRFCQKVSG